MSAEDTLNQKSKRRRGLRRQAEVESLDSVEEIDDEGYEDDDDEESSSRGLTVKKGRATPGRRTQETEVTQEGNFFTRTIRGFGGYVEGVRSEIQKVVWPTPEEVRRLTTIVLVSTIIAAIILGALSFLFNELFILGIQNPAIFGILFVVAVIVFGLYVRQTNNRGSRY
jgi:preprotein translocase SecE subunit